VIACDVQERLVAEIVKLEKAQGTPLFPEVRPGEAA
jgi:hypothetical protein